MARLYKLQSGYYYIYYRQEDGNENKISTKTKVKYEAQKIYEQFVTNKFATQKPVIEEIKQVDSITLGKFCKLFLTYSKAFHTDKTHADYLTTIKYLLKSIPSTKRLNQITIREINYFIHRRMIKSIYAARKATINIKAMFNKAMSEGYITLNPCSQLKRVRIPEKQPLFFSKEEFSSLLSVINNQDHRDVMIFAILTGLRQMEIIEMKWSQVDLNSKTVTLGNHYHVTKSKKIRAVPLNYTLVEMLERKKKQAVNGFVFTFKGKKIVQDNLQDWFKKYVLRANLNPNFHFHSLRHSFASWLVQSGVSLYHVSKLLGHSSISVTEIYAHLNNNDLSMAVETLNQVF
ncbi:MAG: site-specific integrase [Melioribacteraceae bacterium]